MNSMSVAQKMTADEFLRLPEDPTGFTASSSTVRSS